MPRPNPVSPLVLDLLTRIPDLPRHDEDRSLQRLPGAQNDRPTPFDPTTRARPARNFAVQDHLGLATHPRLRAAAVAERSLQSFGAAHSPARVAPILALEERIARFLTLTAAVTFSSGTAAIRATLRRILRPGDAVIVNAGAHPDVFETVLTSNAHLLRTPPGSLDGVERRLLRLSRTPRPGRTWVAVPAISAHASTMADVAELSALCLHYNAGLIVNVTQDLGSMAQGGGGVMEVQCCTGRADVVIGSLAACFGAPGGFAAFRDPGPASGLRHDPGAPALDPVHAATLLAAFDIVNGPEGRRRRLRLHAGSLRLRNHLMADGLRVLGQPSPVVPLRLPAESALARTALLHRAGLSVRLLQTPVVAAHAPRWCLHLTAEHGPAEIDDLADLIRDVTRAVNRRPGLIPSPMW